MKYKYEAKSELYGDRTVELDTKDDKYDLEIGAGHLEWWDISVANSGFDEEEIKMMIRELGDDLRATGDDDIWHEDPEAYYDWVMSSVDPVPLLSIDPVPFFKSYYEWYKTEVCGEKALICRGLWNTLVMKAR